MPDYPAATRCNSCPSDVTGRVHAERGSLLLQAVCKFVSAAALARRHRAVCAAGPHSYWRAAALATYPRLPGTWLYVGP
jgi:hypothetical protein